jgi:serine/threonine protein kinase
VFLLHGDIKVFDFGLSKEIPKEGADANGLFRFTGICETPRYMALGVVMDGPYNESCDIYSFAILLWQMLALIKPYDKLKLTMSMLYSEVWGGPCKRPGICISWPKSVTSLLSQAWEHKFKNQPTTCKIESVLHATVAACPYREGRQLSHDK